MPNNIDLLDQWLNRQIALASDPALFWTLKIRAKRVLAHSPDPEALAARMLRLLQQPLSKAA